jgi:hypothetical protein
MAIQNPNRNRAYYYTLVMVIHFYMIPFANKYSAI